MCRAHRWEAQRTLQDDGCLTVGNTHQRTNLTNPRRRRAVMRLGVKQTNKQRYVPKWWLEKEALFESEASAKYVLQYLGTIPSPRAPISIPFSFTARGLVAHPKLQVSRRRPKGAFMTSHWALAPWSDVVTQRSICFQGSGNHSIMYPNVSTFVLGCLKRRPGDW